MLQEISPLRSSVPLISLGIRVSIAFLKYYFGVYLQPWTVLSVCLSIRLAPAASFKVMQFRVFEVKLPLKIGLGLLRSVERFKENVTNSPS